MIRSAASKVMWVGRATVFLVGLAVILALLFGVASTALGANGKPLILGKAANKASKITGLVKKGAGPALRLRVDSGPPLAVNSSEKIDNLNADKVDGQSLECPSGTLFHEGVCIETSKRGSATFDQAEGDCLDEGNRLATIAELQTFRTRSGHDFATAEWSNEVEMFSSTFRVATTIIPSSGSRLYSVGEQDYRCVRQPL
jgi:hypothetical protein